MLLSAIRRVLLGLALLLAGAVGAFWVMSQVADSREGSPAAALVFIPSLLAVPLGVLLAVLGTLDGARVLRSTGWRGHPVGVVVVGLGVVVSAIGLVALVTLPRACV